MIPPHHPKETAAMRSCRVEMGRYEELLQMAEALWRRERAQKVPVQEVRM